MESETKRWYLRIYIGQNLFDGFIDSDAVDTIVANIHKGEEYIELKGNHNNNNSFYVNSSKIEAYEISSHPFPRKRSVSDKR